MFWTYLCTTLLLITGFLLMFIVLLQRGRGGGLAGAFGGAGGHSAFGTRAGDVFTKITIVMAIIWVALAGITGYAMRSSRSSRYGDEPTGKATIKAKSKTGKSKTTNKLPPPITTNKKSPAVKTKTAKTETEKTAKTPAGMGKNLPKKSKTRSKTEAKTSVKKPVKKPAEKPEKTPEKTKS